MKFYIKASSSYGYLYIFKHGVGPGTLPKDVTINRVKDLPNGYTAVWTDRFLTTEELLDYDIPYETEINRYLNQVGYCQKNGDVVPCDDIEGCDKVTSSTDAEDFSQSNLEIAEKYKPILDKYGYDGDWFVTTVEEEYDYLDLRDPDDLRGAIWNFVLGYICERDDYGGSAQEAEADEVTDKILSEVTACSDVTAPKYFANMVSASVDDGDYDDEFLVEGYYDNQYRGLAESTETSDVSALNEYINDYANRGYFIKVHNLTDGTITQFSPDNWFDDIAPDGGATLFMTW
jgi:uncharacterized protein YutD